MHQLLTTRRGVLTAALFAALVASAAAPAAPVPPADFTCGVTAFDQPCNQTARFDTVAFEGTPLASAHVASRIPP